MIRRIKLSNFMSHANTVIEPAEGLTVLVGPNNCGKSAVVAALQILCHNDNSTYVTRHNERECSVTVETDDGHVVEWRRKNNSPRYTVDGQPFDRLGRSGVPEGLHDVLRLPKVTAEGNQEFDVHFGEQKSPVFLLDKPGSHAAQFFASSSDASKLVEMQKRHQQKMVDARRERAALEAKSARLAADLSILAAADEIGAGVLQVEVQYEQLKQSSSRIEQLTRDLKELHQAVSLFDRSASESRALSPLAESPPLVDPRPLAELIEQIVETRRAFDVQSDRAAAMRILQPAPDVAEERSLIDLLGALIPAESALSRATDDCLATQALAPPPALDDTRDLHKTIGEMKSMNDQARVVDGRLAVLVDLKQAPGLLDETAMAESLRSLVSAASDLRRAERMSECLSGLNIAPPLADPEELSRAVGHLTTTIASANAHEREFVNADKALIEAAQSLRLAAEQERICPTCGAVLDPDRLILRACSTGEGHALA